MTEPKAEYRVRTRSAANTDSPLARAYRWAYPALEQLLDVERQAGGDHLLRMVALGGPDTTHYLGAVLAHPSMDTIAAPEHWADRIAHAPRARVLRDFYGPLPEGFEAALAKLGPRVASPQTYATLFAACGDPETRKVLARAPKLTAALVDLLAIPEARWLHPKILARLAKAKAPSVDALREALQIRARTPPWSERLAGLRTARDAKRVWRWLHYNWELPFPPPPWSGDDLFQPLTTAQALRAAGKAMKNCLGDNAVEVGRGSEYYYMSRTTPRVAVGFVLRAGRWHVSQILGTHNRPLRAKRRQEVVERLMKAGLYVDLDYCLYDRVAEALGEGDGELLRRVEVLA